MIITSRAGQAEVKVTDPGDFIQAHWARGEFFETRLLEYIYWHYKEQVFVDIGSNIGNHTLFFAKFCQPKHVISVEPVPASAVLQREVLHLNGLEKRVTIHECAISDRVGRGAMRPWETNPCYFAGSQTLEDGDEVDVTTLDELLSDVRHINLIKIDVEGRELDVLRGAGQILARERPALFIEMRKRTDCAGVYRFLDELRYRQAGSVFQDAQVVEFTA